MPSVRKDTLFNTIGGALGQARAVPTAGSGDNVGHAFSSYGFAVLNPYTRGRTGREVPRHVFIASATYILSPDRVYRASTFQRIMRTGATRSRTPSGQIRLLRVARYGVSVNVAVCVMPLAVAQMVTLVLAATVPGCIVKVPESVPAATTMVAGTGATLGSELDRVTTTLRGAALPSSVTVPTTAHPPAVELGATVTDCTPMGRTTSRRAGFGRSPSR